MSILRSLPRLLVPRASTLRHGGTENIFTPGFLEGGSRDSALALLPWCTFQRGGSLSLPLALVRRPNEFVLAVLCMPCFEHGIRYAVRAHRVFSELSDLRAWSRADQPVHLLIHWAGLDGGR